MQELPRLHQELSSMAVACCYCAQTHSKLPQLVATTCLKCESWFWLTQIKFKINGMLQKEKNKNKYRNERKTKDETYTGQEHRKHAKNVNVMWMVKNAQQNVQSRANPFQAAMCGYLKGRIFNNNLDEHIFLARFHFFNMLMKLLLSNHFFFLLLLINWRQKLG